MVSTISPDFYFKNKFGELKFIGRDFHKIVFPVKEIFPKNIYFLYYANNEKFTRLVEYKKFTKHKSDTTLVGMEVPSKNGKHYPVPFKSEIKKSHKVDIDDCIEQALELGEIVKNENYKGPLTNNKWWKI